MGHPEMECGVQPLDALLDELGLNNHAVVAASCEHLTHKVVQKGRKGRRLTRHSALKILRAVEQAAPTAPPRTIRDLFNYFPEPPPEA